MKIEDFQIAPDIEGDSVEDTKLLRAMADEVRSYLGGFGWCPGIKEIYLAFGIGGIVGIYLAELEDKIGDQDDFLWVIVGDLPTAYLVVDSITPHEVLAMYCELMSEWADTVESGDSLENVFPVAAEPTFENASMLRKRLSFLKEKILPMLV